MSESTADGEAVKSAWQLASVEEAKAWADKIRAATTEDCYCVCHSDISSRPWCEHCKGDNDVMRALAADRDGE